MFEQLFLGTKARQRTDDLNEIILAARQERDALDALFEQLDGRRGKLAEFSTKIEHVNDKAVDASNQLAVIATRIADFDNRLAGLEALGAQMQEMTAIVRQAQQAAGLIAESEGELQKHRQAMEHLASEYRETRTSVEVLNAQRQIVGEARDELHRSQADLRSATDHTLSVRHEIDLLRHETSALTRDHLDIKRSTQQSQASAAAVSRTLADIESKVASLRTLHELAATTDEQLKSLNALAEHVSVKTKALETQKITIEHAASEANRLNEMVWAMEAQIEKLEEGNRQVVHAEEILRQTERLSGDVQGQLESATERRDQFTRETARIEKDSALRIQAVQGQLERLAIEGKSFDAHEQRIADLQNALSAAERQLETVISSQETVSAVDRKAEALGQTVQQLSADFAELSRHRAEIETVADRVARVEITARDVEARHARLESGRQQLEELRADLETIRASHATAAQLCDQLKADREALEMASGNITRFSADAPALEKQIGVVLDKFHVLDDADRKAERLRETVTELEAGFVRANEKLQFVDKVERRLNGLHMLNTEVGRRLEEQLARRGELDMMRTRCEEIATHINDAHQKLGAIATVQEKLPALVDTTAALSREIAQLDTDLNGIKRSEAELTEQEKRLADLVTAAQEHHATIAERTKHIEALGESLSRGSAMKNDLLMELAGVEARHRETAARIGATEEQLKQVDALRQQLDDRQSVLTVAGTRIAAFETKVEELTRRAADTEVRIQAIAGRETMVAAVKAEVDRVQEVASAAKSDVQALVERRDELQTLRTRLDTLVHALGDTDERIAAIEARRRLVEEVQTRTEMIANLLEDVGANLEMVAAQKAQVDHVAEQVARLEFSVQESQNTMRALQQERARAERVEQAIRQLRTREQSTRQIGTAAPVAPLVVGDRAGANGNGS